MPHLAFRDQVLHGAGGVLDRHVGIDPVLVQEIDDGDPQPLQRGLGNHADAFRPAVQEAAALRPAQVEAELGGDGHLALERLERLANEFLIGEGVIDLGRVEEGDAALDGRAGERDHFIPIRGRAAVMVHPHAAQADG